MRFRSLNAKEYYYARYHAVQAAGKLRSLQGRLKAMPSLKNVHRFKYELKIAQIQVENTARDEAYWAEKFSEELKYDPNQPRVPAGHPTGGQWTSGGAENAVQEVTDPNALLPLPADGSILPDDSIKPADDVFLLLTPATSLTKLGIRAALGVADFLTSSALGERAATIEGVTESQSIKNIANDIEEWFGGPAENGYYVNGNYTFLRGDKQFRMDLNPRPWEEPHFHFQIYGKDTYGEFDWLDAIPGRPHQFPFKGGK